MAKRIDLPQTPRGDAEEQLRTLYSYLYQMAETLNNNLAEIGGAELTDDERRQLTEIIGDGTLPEGQLNEAETLKSLIVKTANFVQSTLTEYRMNLLGEYVADGKFGKYVRRTGLDVDVTPTGIQQNFTFQEIIQGLKTYEINAKNYIKTGLLRTVNNLPVYGVAIGKDVVTFAEDGTETYNDGNKVAELTADELSFWQGGNKIASYTGSGITLYYGTSKILEIGADGMTVWKAGTKLAEMLSSGLTFYNNGDKRVATDSNGVTIYKGSTKLAELLGSALTFYHNGVKRAVTDANGMAFYKDSTKLAELLSSGLKFYYNGTLRTQMDTDGVKIYDGSTLLLKITGSRISFYYNGNEVFYILNGKIYAAGDMEIGSGKTFKVVSGGAFEVESTNFNISEANKKLLIYDTMVDRYGITFLRSDHNASNAKMFIGDADNQYSTSGHASVTCKFEPNTGSTEKGTGILQLYSKKDISNDESISTGFCVDWGKTPGGANCIAFYKIGVSNPCMIGTHAKPIRYFYVNKIIGPAENNAYESKQIDIYPNSDANGGITNRAHLEITEASGKVVIWGCDSNGNLNNAVFHGRSDLSGSADRVLYTSTNVTNMNNLTTAGLYYLVAPVGNAPSGISGGFEVWVTTQTPGSYDIMQKIFTGSAIYTRTRYLTTWTSWYKFTGTAV